MKKILFLLLVSVVAFTSCLKDDEVFKPYDEQLAIDIEKITDYLDENNLVAESLPSGVYYIIEEEGIGSYPTLDSLIDVQYVGTYLSGSEFDSGTLSDYQLGGLIMGWRVALPLFREGSRGTIFIPSGLGYGSADYHGIPANSVLVFDINLISVSEN